MRYVVAMVFAIIVVGLAAVFLSSHVADWVVSHQRFDSSDAAENLHMLTFIGTNVVAPPGRLARRLDHCRRPAAA
jgi:hypothetical protein